MKGRLFMKRALILIILGFSLNNIYSQYRIEFQINPLKSDTLILAQYFNKTFSVQDTGIIDQTGRSVLEGQVSLPQGLYMVYLSPSLRFDLIIGEDQAFTINTDTSDFVASMVVKESDENEVFYQYQRFLSSRRDKSTNLQERITNASSAKDSV